MVKYLSALKNKRGFTVVELVVVIAIIAVLAGLMAAGMSDRESNKIIEANQNSAAFMTAVQYAFTDAEFTERQLVDYAPTDKKYIEYTDGKNIILGDTTADSDYKYLFIEVKVRETGIQYLHIGENLPELMSMDETKTMTKLENYFMKTVGVALAEAYEGYFYAQVDSGFRVVTTHFSESRMPIYSASMSKDDYHDSLIYESSSKINKRIVGYCSDVTELSKAGNFAFNAPEPTAAGGTKYFG
ncbi:MAG: type II secretion system protein [Oscillospiraceae bacterium]